MESIVDHVSRITRSVNDVNTKLFLEIVHCIIVGNHVSCRDVQILCNVNERKSNQF